MFVVSMQYSCINSSGDSSLYETEFTGRTCGERPRKYGYDPKSAELCKSYVPELAKCHELHIFDERREEAYCI